MSPNELAKFLDDLADDWLCESFDNRELRQAAIMIRQQQAELKEKGELAQAWILYATKIEMLMPTICETNIAKDLGWSMEYLKGYNDAIREVRAILRKAQEK